MKRALVLGMVAAACAGCGTQAALSRLESQVLRCMHENDWTSTATYHNDRVVEFAATDGHAQLEITFWATRSEARRAVPALAPAGVGWTGSVSWRSSIGFTLADEQTVDRCLAPDRWP